MRLPSHIMKNSLVLFRRRIVITLLGFFVVFPSHIFAHGPGLFKAEQLSEQIARHGSNVSLYVERARIYQSYRHWKEALVDLDAAAQLEPDNTKLDLMRAEILYSMKEYSRALDLIELYELRHKPDLEAMLIAARSYRELGLNEKAAQYYKKILSKLKVGSEVPLSEWYIEYVDVLMLAGKKSQALNILQQGIHALGSNSVFQTRAAELEVELGDYESAISRIDALAEKSQRKDFWLARRGDILTKAGLTSRAKSSYQEAFSRLQKLPLRLRNQPASVELNAKLKVLLAN